MTQDEIAAAPGAEMGNREGTLLPEQIYGSLTLLEAESYIDGNLVTAARAYVANGYFLKRIRDDRLYEEAGYKNFDGYVQAKYGKKKDWASKCIKVNAQLSIGGDSPYLDSRYRDYSTYQLVELAYMTEEQREQAAPEQTVKELRELRKPKEVPYFPIEGQLELETDFPEVIPGPVSADLPTEPQTFLMSVEDVLNMGQEIREKVAISQQPEIVQRSESAAEMQQNEQGCCESETELLSAYGTKKRIYLPDSLIATQGCEGGHYCFSCAMECEIRGEDRYCREAPMGNPFPCEHIVWGLQALQDEIGARCQFINHDLADHYAGSGEADPCCKNCSNPCEYICGRAMRKLDEQKEDQGTDSEPTDNETDAEFTEAERPSSDKMGSIRAVLQKESAELDNWLKAFEGEPAERIPPIVEQKKIIVAALASMLSDLENAELLEQQQWPRAEQPDLPEMKNNDQRKEFLNTFHDWPVWFKVPEASEVYYRYDLPDRTALVICEYHYYATWMDTYGYGDGSPEKTGTREYLLTPGYHYLDDCRSNRSAMVEKLKEIQKKGEK